MLTLTNVRKTFGKTVAVDGLSLSVGKGELFGLLGPNGSGKSTTVSLAVGLLTPDAGTIAIEGLGNPASTSVRQHIGVAPQAIALYDLLSGEENLRFFGEVYGLSGAALAERVAWCLDFVGLTDRKDDAIGKYSGGMKRRLNLAAALMHDPQLLLLDEPTVGVDPQSRNKIFENIEADMQAMFTDPAASTRMADRALAKLPADPALAPQVAPVRRFLGELKRLMGTAGAPGPPGAGPGGPGAWQPLKVTAKPVARERRGPDNAFDITFPQGIVWGLIGCVMTFGISLVTERTHGTLVRLRMAPLTRTQILGGKALACFVSIMLVEVILLAVAVGFGVRPSSMAMLTLAGVSAAICFVGFMMLVASLGKTEQTAAGAGWAILMPLSMLGGAMVPQFVMPQWMQTAGMVSPIRWVILAIEGGIWRGFTLNEMLLPCAILVSVGIVCFIAGTRGLKEA